MPAWTTSLLRELVAVPNVGPASTSSTPLPLLATSLATAIPTTPAPTTTQSALSLATPPPPPPPLQSFDLCDHTRPQAPRPNAILIVFSESKHIPSRSNRFLYMFSSLSFTTYSSSTGNLFVSFLQFSTGSAMERGVRRIMVDISRWQPSPDRFHLLLSLLPTHDRSSVTRSLPPSLSFGTWVFTKLSLFCWLESCITRCARLCRCLASSLCDMHLKFGTNLSRFVRPEDRKRAIVSRLLQYYVVNDVLGIPFNEINIRRTLLGKPYLVRPPISCRNGWFIPTNFAYKFALSFSQLYACMN